MEGPTTFPASGIVEDAEGVPLSGGFIEFQSTTDQNMMAVGNIQTDGSFSLITYVNGVATEGAVPGEHRVTVHPREIEHGGAPPVPLRELHQVEAKENVFSVKLPRR